jgi:hypothetical protein
LEYEAILYEKLRSAGIPFVSEDALRGQGFYKTPDAKLEVRSSSLELLWFLYSTLARKLIWRCVAADTSAD